MDNYRIERQEMEISMKAAEILKKDFRKMSTAELKEGGEIIADWLYFDVTLRSGKIYLSNTLNKVLMDEYDHNRKEIVTYELHRRRWYWVPAGEYEEYVFSPYGSAWLNIFKEKDEERMFEMFCDGDLYDVAIEINERMEKKDSELNYEMIKQQKVEEIKDIMKQGVERKMIAETVRELVMNYVNENFESFFSIREELENADIDIDVI